MKLYLEGEKEVVLETASGSAVKLRSSTPAPPGSTLALRSPDVSQPFQLKVRACRRDQGGLFAVEGRWVNLSTSQRDALVRAGFQGH